jgi:hypothetical protein
VLQQKTSSVRLPIVGGAAAAVHLSAVSYMYAMESREEMHVELIAVPGNHHALHFSKAKHTSAAYAQTAEGGLCIILYCRQVPAQLSAATQLTSLALEEPKGTPLSIAAGALPYILQRLRLTEEVDRKAARRSNGEYDDDDDAEHSDDDAANTSLGDAASLPRLQRDSGALSHLRHLQLTVYSRGVQSLPTG